MKTTKENLLKWVGGCELHEDKVKGVSLVFVYQDEHYSIYYKFYDGKYPPNAWIRDRESGEVFNIKYWDDVEDIIKQIYYMTGYGLYYNDTLQD